MVFFPGKTNASNTPGGHKFLARHLPLLIVAAALVGPLIQAAATPAPPSIEISYPPNEYVTRLESITVMGTLSDGDWERVTVGDFEALLHSKGRFSALTRLNPGRNEIEVTAYPREGAAVKKTTVVHLGEAPPRDPVLQKKAAPAEEAPEPQRPAQTGGPEALEGGGPPEVGAIDPNAVVKAPRVSPVKLEADFPAEPQGMTKGEIVERNPRLSLLPGNPAVRVVPLKINGESWPDKQLGYVDVFDGHVYISMDARPEMNIGAQSSGKVEDGWTATMPPSNVHQGVAVRLSCSGSQECRLVSEYNQESRPVYRKGGQLLFPVRFLFESLGSPVQWSEAEGIQVGGSRFAPKETRVAFGGEEKILKAEDYYLAPDGRVFISIDFLRNQILKEETVKSPATTDFSFARQTDAVTRRVTLHYSSRYGFEAASFRIGDRTSKTPIRASGLSNRSSRQSGIPLRETLEALGFKVKWDNSSKTFAIS